MDFNYPNGRRYQPKTTKKQTQKIARQWTYGNRGMTLEEDLNETNEYYLTNQIAVVHKKPTPVQIVHVDYPNRSAAVIKEAYFKQPSTTDYNGVYKGKHLDFEAKETRNATSFPLKNFHDHQINHMKKVIDHGGFSFVIIRFSLTEEVFFLEAHHLFSFWKRMMDGGRKSITKKEINEVGIQIPLGLQPRIDYIKVIDQLYG